MYKLEIYDNRDLTKASGSVVYIYAKWKAEISFDANGHGTAPADVEIIGPDNVTLSTISETGWTFGGWYDGSDWETSNFIGNGGESIFFDKPMDLYAKWTAVDYTINYDPKGGTVIGDASFTKTYDTAITVDLATASLTGYTFDGWYVDDETFNTPYDKTNDDIYVDGTLTYTIYAKWIANTYTIEYDAKGGTITGATSFTKTYGTPYTGSLATPTRRGYIFGGWHKDDETFTYLYNKSNDDIYVEGTSTYKIYAKWTAINYIVSYNAKGGTITGDASFTKTYGTAITYNLASPSRAGYTFGGWYRDDNTFNVPYNKSNDDIYVEGTLAYTIYAKWTANEYKINYDTKGGTVVGSPSFIKTYGTPYGSDLKTPTRRGYAFGGWFRDDNTFNTPYNKNNDDIYVDGTLTYTIYAKWTAISYTVNYNVKGGSITGDAWFTKTYDTAYAENLKTPTRRGYTFGGWY